MYCHIGPQASVGVLEQAAFHYSSPELKLGLKEPSFTLSNRNCLSSARSAADQSCDERATCQADVGRSGSGCTHICLGKLPAVLSLLHREHLQLLLANASCGSPAWVHLSSLADLQAQPVLECSVLRVDLSRIATWINLTHLQLVGAVPGPKV